MRIDLHTHSQVSDGTEPPADVMRAAAAAGLDVVALTDHDTAAGWAEAEQTARELGLTLVPGMEISTQLEAEPGTGPRQRRRGVHLLAYLPDPTYPPLAAALVRVLDGRNDRVPAILAALAGLGIELEHDRVALLAGPTAAMGRPHIADALVDLGVVADRTEAFRTFLNPGRPAYVDRYAASLDDMVRLVVEAGGVAVIAHPWGRHRPEGLGEEELARLQGIGLSGIEVDHQDHDPSERERLRAIARNLGLLMTGSSDYHGTGKIDHDLGCNTTHPDELARLLELAAASAARAGRGAQPVVAP
ncbi:PHP domain-containing protein [Nocardioides pacificus]